MTSISADIVAPQISDSTPVKQPTYLSKVFQAMREGATIAEILRLGGAALMVFSMSLFLMQGVDAASDLYRFLLLLGQTALLSVAGFSVGLLLKEPRGARVFFSLALISIPANFAVLGAMIYSIVPLDSFNAQYPTYASWQSSSANELLLASAAGLCVMIPMTVFCFSVFARHAKWWLSAAYLLASAMLLIPVRDTYSVAIMAGISTLAVLVLVSKKQEDKQSLATFEGRFSKCLLFVPAALMLARSVILYDVDFYSGLAIVVGIYYLLRHQVSRRTSKTILTVPLHMMTASCAMVLAYMLGMLIEEQFNFIEPALVFGFIWFVLIADLTRFIDSPRTRGVMHGLWSVVCTSLVAIELLAIQASNGFLVSLTLATLVLVGSTVMRHKLGAFLGSIALIGVFAVNGADFLIVIRNAGWAVMAILGAITIVAGSLLEKYWPVVKMRLANQFRSKRSATADVGGLEREQNSSVTLVCDESLPDVAA